MMEYLTLTPDEFSELRYGFMGGHTHANSDWVRYSKNHGPISDVDGYDFKSSYPAVMVMEKFPRSPPYHLDFSVTDQELEYLLKTRCCMFVVQFTGLRSKLHFEHPISRSKCIKFEGITDSTNEMSPMDNGRVIEAKTLTTVCTELDFDTIRKFYSWESMEISDFIYFDKQYLPTPIVKTILELFKNKTELDGVEGEEINYLISKGMLNAIYGMMVTNPIRDEIVYDDIETQVIKPDMDKAMAKYNGNKNRFLYYPWGVWVTAYARHNLFSGIEEAKHDYVYSDTDSLYLVNGDKHKKYFVDYNNRIRDKIEAAAKFHNIDPAEFSPLNPKGDRKVLGIWDYQGHYDKFKTLGAKRYMYTKDGKEVLTLAGVNKKSAMEYFLESGDPYAAFCDEACVPKEHSGRLTVTYIDEPTSGYFVDYMGNCFYFEEDSSVHMEPVDFHMQMSADYLAYLLRTQELH